MSVNSELFWICIKAWIILISQKYLLWISSKPYSIKQCSKLEQCPIMKFLAAEKWKLCENYRRICDVYGEACFNFKMFKDDLNMSLSVLVYVKKTVCEVKTHWLYSKNKKKKTKKKRSGAAISKEGHTNNLLEHAGPFTIEFLKKRCNCKQYFLLPMRKVKFTLSVDHYIYIYI